MTVEKQIVRQTIW